MELSRKIRSLKTTRKIVAQTVYGFSVLLILTSIFKFAFGRYALFIALLNIFAALGFILIYELSKTHPFSAFSVGTFYSLGLVLGFFYIIESIEIISFETLLFILIDAALKWGDKINTEINSAEVHIQNVSRTK